MSSWQTPKTNWGQPGQTVPGADDFNRIEGNTQDLKNMLDSHAATSASFKTLGHVKLDSALYTGLEVTEAGILRLKHNPQMISGSAEYTDSFQVVFNETKYIYLITNFLPFRLLTVFIRNMADPQKYLLYQIFPYKGYTRGVVQGRNSSGDHIVLPYPIGGDALGAVSGANSVGYGVAGTNGVSITLRGIRTESPIALEIAFAGSPSASLNCRIEYLLS